MKVIGLCGRSGSGKGYVSGKFKKFGVPSIDTDKVYRELTSDPDFQNKSCLCALRERFGDGVIALDGTLDRRALAAIVFAEDGKNALADLNAISHKFILEETRRRIADCERSGCPAVIVDAPLLFESGFDSECDVIVSVICSEETSLSRIMKRDGISREDALRRLKSQKPLEFLTSHSHYVIENELEAPNLEAEVERILKSILQ